MNSYASDSTVVSSDEHGNISQRLDFTDASDHANADDAAQAQSRQNGSILPLPKGAMAMPLASSSYDLVGLMQRNSQSEINRLCLLEYPSR